MKTVPKYGSVFDFKTWIIRVQENRETFTKWYNFFTRFIVDLIWLFNFILLDINV